MYPINVVEKETNISKYLLRMWERRYSFPRPQRDEKGERLYTNEDVEKLNLVKKLMEEGYRPSKIINQTLGQLRELSKSFSGGKASDTPTEVVILLTNPSLEHQLRLVLQSQNIKKTIVVSSQEDVRNLSL